MEKVTLGGGLVLIKKGVESEARFFLQKANLYTGGEEIIEGEDVVVNGIRKVRFQTSPHYNWEHKREILELYFV